MKDGEALHAAVHGVTKSWTQLSNRTTTSILAWEIPWTEEPVEPQSNGVAKSQT